MISPWSWSCVWVLLLCCSPALPLPLLHPVAKVPQWLDLTHPLDSTSRHWFGFLDFNLTVAFNGTAREGYWAAVHNFVSSEHTGTHMDAPIHVGTNGTLTVDQIPPEHLVAHAALLDISARCQTDPDAILTPADLAAWTRQHGPFVFPTVVLLRTGQAAHRGDINRYWGLPAGTPWPEKVDFATAVFPDTHIPGFGVPAARLLADDPAVVGVGLDAPSLDQGINHQLEAHQILLGRNMFGLENVADMSGVPAAGATILALPMKIGGGTGGPTRILIRLPDDKSAQSA